MWVEFRKLPPYAVVMQEQRRRVLITTIWFGSTLFMAVFVPNIGAVISVLGCLAALFIFAFPGNATLLLSTISYDVILNPWTGMQMTLIQEIKEWF